MEAIGSALAVLTLAALSLLGTVSMWQGGRFLGQALALRRRGVWVPGVIERRLANGVPFAVYQYVDLDGRTRFANMTSGKVPKAHVTPTEIRIDPAGRVPPRHLREAESWHTAGAVGLVLFGVACWVLFGVLFTHTSGSSDGPPEGLAQPTRSAYSGFLRM